MHADGLEASAGREAGLWADGWNDALDRVLEVLAEPLPCAHVWEPHVIDYEICGLCHQERWLGSRV